MTDFGDRGDVGDATHAPADIRAFLIADVRGYTLFTQERGDEAAAKLAARFARVAREGVDARAGKVIELRGDEALCVFGSPRQAIRAAVELQERFVEETLADPALPLGVGIGLDAGEAVPVEGGYRGGALNLAARLCGQAGPGEILASREIVHLARRVDGVTYVDRGELTFKGLADPVRVVEVSSEAGPAAARLAPVLPKREPPRPPERARRRMPHRLLIAILALLAVTLAITIPALLLRGGSGLTRVEPNSIGVIDPETGDIVRSIALPNSPGSMAAGHGAVWVTVPGDGEILRIDAKTATVVDSIRIGASPAGIAVGAGAVWVVDSAGPSLVRVSPDTNEKVKTIPVGNGPAGVAVAGGAVWVTNRIDGTVSRIDPDRNEEIATIPVGDAPSGIAGDRNGVWVANSDSGTVVRIDAGTNNPDKFAHVGNQPGPVAVGPDGVWVGNTLDSTVSRIDLATGTVVQLVPVGQGPSAIAFVADSAWVTNEFGGTVSRVSADTDAAAATVSTVSAPRGAAAVADDLWVSVGRAATSHRGGTLRVVSGDVDSLDPAVPDPSVWPIHITTNDGLVGFKRTGGVDGRTLVPDLAVSLPTPTNDGKTYRFQLRDGIRYSTGEPVGASDFRRALERGSRLGSLSYFTAIVGADQCTQTPAACDLSKGIETNDVAGTVAFNLTEPDPSFLYKLALPIAYPVPTGTPFADIGRNPLPATGPYMIERYEPGRELVLVRNPQFQEWYAAAQPDGYPDRIAVTLGLTPREQLTAVERGRADWMTDSHALTGEDIETLITRYAGRVHSYPQQATFWIALNSSMPPFDDVRARRAVNYALDRSEVVELLGGPQRARATCQFLPPNLPGYEPYCPYTLEPNPAGEWAAPDLDRARKLIRASGTAGNAVAFGIDSFFPEPAARYLSGLFAELGYRVRPVQLEEPEALYGSRDRFQAGTSNWFSDFPSATDFFVAAPVCGGGDWNPFSAAFCDPRLDATIRRAEQRQSSDPQQAAELWRRADRRIVDQSPFVSLINPIGLDFVSARVGNYQHHPQWGILLDQLWVR